jgi:hypothetical protein
MKFLCLNLILLCILLASKPARGQTPTQGARSVSDTALQKTKDSLDMPLSARIRSSKLFLDNDFAFGGTIGTPGGLNFIAEKYIRQFGIRAEFGAFGLFPLWGVAGYQADLCYVIHRDNNSLIECSIFYSNTFSEGADNEPPDSFSSNAGASLAFDAGGFFMQAGFTPSFFKTFSQHGLLPSIFQIGYVH